MKLTEYEHAMLAGEFGEPKRLALEQQVKVGRFFDAEDLVEVSQAHIMADTESLGESGVEFLERLAACPEQDRQVVIPTITDPRGVDQCQYKRLKQQQSWAFLELRTVAAMRAMGIMMTDTCINYQTVQAPVMGQHLAFGDTGVVIYSNSVCGARSNFEGGPAALAAGLTGRTPRYGYHLDRCRRGTHLFEIDFEPTDLAEWGALGAIIGRESGSYWTVPVIARPSAEPGSDELKHFGAAMASYGSVPMFHIVGVTPEAPDLKAAFDGAPPAARRITRKDVDDYNASFGLHNEKVDVVVFGAPQLSLIEMRQVAMLLKGRKVHDGTTLLVATNPENKAASDRMGFTETIEASGAIVLSGVCFYQMYAREMGEANNWKRLLTNSAKLCNIITGYGYEPVIAPMDRCVDAAVKGKM
ncbi:MAG: aconitase X catalytic domain-containing protein [Aquisalimonadaceae bacterium]